MQAEPLIYRKEESKEKKTDADDSESSSDENVDESELKDKQCEAEDAILKDNAAKEVGRIIKDEQDEIIKVLWSSYK